MVPPLPSQLSPLIPQAGGMVNTSEGKPQEGGRKTTSHDTVHPLEDPKGDQQQRVDHVVGGG